MSADEPPFIADEDEEWLRERAAYYCVSVDEMRAFIEGDSR